jgi:hypothetical protein
MEIILTSSNEKIKVVTGYDKERKLFQTCIVINGKEKELESFENINEMVATHDFWCKVTGIIKQTYNKNEVDLHKKAISEIVNRGEILSA